MNTGTTISFAEASDGTSNATVTTLRPFQRPFSDVAIVVSASILLILMVFGVAGNLMTIVVIVKSKTIRGVFNTFILSLCISDLTSAIISPLFLYRRTWGYDVWRIPSVFCKIYWGTDLWTSFVTALHILVFAILRLISVRWPHSYIRTKTKHARICIVTMWVTSFFLVFVPFVIWFNSEVRPRNTDLLDSRWPACSLILKWSNAYYMYQMIMYPLFFYVPTILIIVLTVLIGILLNKRKKERDAKLSGRNGSFNSSSRKKAAYKEKKAMLQLSLIASSFMLGYVPFTAYEISSVLATSLTPADERFWWRFGMTEYICLRFSETLNPVFYNLSSPKLRGETFRTFRALIGKLRKSCSIRMKSTPSVSSSSSVNANDSAGNKSTICTNNAIRFKSHEIIVTSPARKV